MAEVKVSIVHDELGEILSVSRPEGPNVIVLAGERQAVLETEIDGDKANDLVGTHRVDLVNKTLESY